MSSLISNWIYSHEPIKRFYLNLPTFGAYDLVCECVVFFLVICLRTSRDWEKWNQNIAFKKHIADNQINRHSNDTKPNKCGSFV